MTSMERNSKYKRIRDLYRDIHEYRVLMGQAMGK